MRSWELVRLALDGIRRTPLRVALTSLGVAIATAALVAMVSFALAVQARVEEPFQKMEILNRIDVTPRSEGGHQHSPVLDAAALRRIAALPGVVLAYPELRVKRIEIIRGGHSTMASAVGLPRTAARLRFVREAIVAGRFFDRTGRGEAILGTRLVKDLGFGSAAAAVGATLTLKVQGLAPDAGRTFRLERRQARVEVVGVWKPPGGRHGFSAGAILLPLDLIREWPGVQSESDWERLWHWNADTRGQYGRAVVRVDRPVDLFAAEQRIQAMGFETQTFLGQVKQMRIAFVVMDLVLSAVGAVGLVVAGLGIINTMLMTVLERYREIGTYKALGASDGDVRVLFLAEAGLVGLLGGCGGLVLGRVVAWVIQVVVNAVARSKGIDERIVMFAFPVGLLLGAVLFAVVVSVLSGVYPASRAARLDPIRALRAE